MKQYFDKLKDLFLFSEGSEVDNYIVPPTVTTGSILWGVLLRSILIILISLFVVLYLEWRSFLWFVVFIFWFTVVYPAYNQYNKFHSRLSELQEDTMCGKCNHFIAESQLCAIYDEHIGTLTIPCNGQQWEANPNIFNKD